jgi:AcrR family transcriptional regulator
MLVESRAARKKAATKEKIFQAAMELFLEQGYDKTTVEQIAEKADVAKGTFFNYFPAKDELLVYLGKQRVLYFEEMLENELNTIPSAKEKLFACLIFFAQESEENREITALVAKTLFANFFSVVNKEKEVHIHLNNILSQIIIQGQVKGEFSSDYEPQRIADIMIGDYFFTLFQWLDNGFEDTLTVELTKRAEFIINGLLK